MKTRKLLVYAFCAMVLGCSGTGSGGTADSSAAVASQPATPPIDPTLWLTSGSGHKAEFDSSTTRAKLVQRFGALNVVEDSV